MAHVGGMPLEEILPALPGAGAVLLLARDWLMLRLRRLSARGRRGAAPRGGHGRPTGPTPR
jgi:hypothetical protein